MDPNRSGMLLFICCVIQVMTGSLNTAAPASEQEDQVEIQFYQMKQSDWSDVEADFKDVIATSLNAYCRTNYQTCGLNGWNDTFKFTSINVNVISTEELKYYLNVTFFVSFSSNIPSESKSTSVVTHEALLEIIKDNYRDVNARLGYDIVAAAENRYYPEPNTELNRIIIPTVIVVFFILVIITVALYYARKQQDMLEQRKLAREQRKSKSFRKQKKTQQAASDNTTPTRVSRISPAPEGSINRQEINHQHQTSAHSFAEQPVAGKQNTTSLRSSTFRFSASAALSRNDSDSFQGNQTEETVVNMSDSLQRNAMLPPLDEGTKSEEKKKKSKRHKKHRSHKKSSEEEFRLQQNESDSDVHGSRDQNQPNSALPPPLEYHKSQYHEGNISDSVSDSTRNLPPV